MKKVTILTVMIMMGLSLMAHADTTQDVNVAFEIPALFQISWDVDGSTINLVGVDAITATELSDGYRDAIDGGDLEVVANAAYDLTVVASDIVFSGGNNDKPLSDLEVDIDGSGNQALDGTNEVTIINGHAAESYIVKGIDYYLNVSVDDGTGVFTTTLTYTIKADV